MNSLENILDITIAIRAQMRYRKGSTPKLVEDLIKIEEKFLDLGARVKDKEEDTQEFLLKQDKELSEKREMAYNPLKAISEYISMFKDKLYDYYSGAKRTTKKVAKSLGYKIITEIEDWGVIFFKPTFNKMVRLTPMGAMARYQQKLWLYVGKTVK